MECEHYWTYKNYMGFYQERLCMDCGRLEEKSNPIQVKGQPQKVGEWKLKEYIVNEEE